MNKELKQKMGGIMETETQKWLYDWFIEQYGRKVQHKLWGEIYVYDCPVDVYDAFQRLYNSVEEVEG